MFCKYCGNKIDDDSTFCENCGARVEKESPKKSVPDPQIEPSQKTVFHNAIKTSTTPAMKRIGKKVVAAILSGCILCGSMIGTIVNAAPVTVNIFGNTNESATLVNAYSSYDNLLKKEKEYIDAYTWQKGHYGNGDYTYQDEPKPVVFADVFGDDTPELLFVKAPDKNYTSTFEIYTHNNGELSKLYSEENWDPLAGGGFYYTLFQVKGDNALYAYQTGGDETWETSYFRFEKGDKNTLTKTEICQYKSTANYETNTPDKTYFVEGKETDENKYNDTVKSLTDKISAVLMTSANSDEVFANYIESNGCSAATTDDALVFLNSQMGSPYQIDAENVSKSMTQFLLQFRFGYGKGFFDSNNPYTDDERDNIIYRIMTNATCCNSYIYPGENGKQHWGDDGAVDPRKKYVEGNYCAFSEYHIDKAKWIAKNIFNISDDNIEKLIQNGISDELFYIEDGIAYLKLGGVGGPQTDIKYDSVKFDGKRYQVVGTHYVVDFYDESAERFNAELDYKNISGTYYWSLYKQEEAESGEELDESDKVNEENLFNYLNGIQFTFTSGIGGWGTSLTIDSNGYFEGTFSDTDYVFDSSEYNALISESKFSGTFENPKKIDKYVYSISLKDIKTEKPVGESWINKELSAKIVAAEPYGMEVGKTFYIYLPGTKSSGLPEEFVGWITSSMEFSESSSTLPFWGMYNEEGKYGFYSSESEFEYSVVTPNKAKTQSIKFNENKKVDLKWGWELFDKDSSEYDHNIAMAGLILSQAAELGQGEIEQRYKSLGFENTRAINYNTRADYMDMPAACFASSVVKFNGKNKYIVSITVRGTDTNDMGDILTDIGSVIYGFNTAANNVRDSFKSYYDSLSNYYGEKVTADNSILFITGHSLGGAIAGQLGQMLEGSCSHRNSIFDYTFASPNYQTFEYDRESFTNIHNIINKQDIVPTIPWGYGKYGHCWYYDSCENGMTEYLKNVYTEDEWEDIQKGLNDNTLILVGAFNRGFTGIVSNHICQTYLACMLKDIPQNMGAGAKSQYSLSSIHCPVDIKVVDKDGNIAAWTKGKQVFYADGANLVVIVDEDEKYVYVPAGIEYNIVFTGTGNGTMTFVQQTIVDDEVASEKTFENVDIEPDKMFYASVDIENAKSQKLQVINSNGEIEKNVSESGKETKPLFNFSWVEWLFIIVDVISGAVLIINLIGIVKEKKKKA